MRRWRRPALVLALAAAVVGAWGSAAQAHALLKHSVPAQGAKLASSPPKLVLTFTEAPDPKLSVVSVLSSTGATVSTASAQPVPGQPEELELSLPKLPDGVYTVNWRTVSRVDGHVTGGSFAFGIGQAPGPTTTGGSGTVAGTGSTSLTPAAVAGRFALYWGLALLVGGAAVVLLVTRGRFPASGRWLLAGGWTMAAAGIVVSILAERAAVGFSLGTLLGSGAGRPLVEQAIAVGVAGIGVAVALARPGRVVLGLNGAVAAVGLWFHAMGSHANAASPYRPENLAVIMVHLLAVAVWIGGLAWLLLAIRGKESSERRAAAGRFSLMATVAVIAVVGTGIARAASELGGWHPLFHTSFGRALIVKAALVGALVAVGAVNRFWTVPRVSAGTGRLAWLRGTVSGEIVLATGVLIVAGVLSSLPPGSYFNQPGTTLAAAHPVIVTGSDFGTTVRVRLEVAPGTVGENTFRARVLDYDTGRPVPATSVGLRFSLPSQTGLGQSTLDLRKLSPGVWQGRGSMISILGKWHVDVTVQTPTTGVDVPLSVSTRLPPEQIATNAVAGQPTLYTIALAGGRTLQTYLDPGKVGPDTVHFTFFTSSGNEQPIASATAAEISPGGASRPLKLIRFGRGHFAANVTLGAGKWTFEITGSPSGASGLFGYFSQQVG